MTSAQNVIQIPHSYNTFVFIELQYSTMSTCYVWICDVLSGVVGLWRWCCIGGIVRVGVVFPG